MNTNYRLINNFKCKKCGDLVLSLHRHDYRCCSCGNFVDGGFDYYRMGGKIEDMKTLPLYWKLEVK